MPQAQNPVQQTMPAAHRQNVTAADVLAAPTTTAPSAQAGGSCAANTYNTRVVGVNAYGRTVPSTKRNATTATTNLAVRIPITQLVGALFYDIYCSTDAEPLWVGRITEAQRASGILITAVGTTGAGGVAGAVDVQVPGTGLAAATTAAENTAYVIPSQNTDVVVDAVGWQYVDFEITAVEGASGGDAVALAVTVVIFTQNPRLGSFAQHSAPTALTFGGTSGNLQPMIQRIRAEVRADDAVWLLVSKIAGTGASLNVDAMLS